MLTSDAIAATVKRAAAEPLRGHTIAGLMQELTSDSVGEAVVDVRTVLAGDSDVPDGDAIVDVNRALRMAGEERTVMVTFGTEAELAAYADP